MPTVQFAEVPNKSFISNNCCVFAIMFINIVARGVLDLQPNFQKLLWTRFHAIVTNVLSETKPKNVIFQTYFQCAI